MKYDDVKDSISQVLISHDELDAKLDEIAAQISKDYADVDNLLCIGVLKGAAYTLVSVTRRMSISAPIDFMSLSSYGSGMESSHTVTVRSDLTTDVAGKNVLILEDIVDSGYTLNWLIAELKRRGAASVKVMALLSKPERREYEVPIDYLGFTIPNEFVVGFGMDYNDHYRNLDFIGVLDPKVYAN